MLKSATSRSSTSAPITSGRLWHRLQRQWPFLKLDLPFNEDPVEFRTVADVPNANGHAGGATADLEVLIQGSYNGAPACLMKFTLEHAFINNSQETSFEFRLSSGIPGAAMGSTARRAPSIAAYGPAHIIDPSTSPIGTHTKSARPASITTYRTDHGLCVVVRRSKPGPGELPSMFHFLMIVVDIQGVELRVIPSVDYRRRALIFMKTMVRLIFLDGPGTGPNEGAHCALQGNGGCHPTCDNYGVEHMTLEVWKRNLDVGPIVEYGGVSPGNVSPRAVIFLKAYIPRSGYILQSGVITD